MARVRRIEAVAFDLDGVLVESEQLWNAAREQLTVESGGHWSARPTREMMGMSSKEWARYMHDQLRVPLEPEQISDQVVRRMEQLYRQQLPLIDGARDAVLRLAARWPVAVASAANRPLIELVLEVADLASAFEVTVSAEEVEHGKPAPDVYLAAAARLGVDAARCAAIEDSTNGILAARAADMRVIAIPNRVYPPSDDALAAADVVLDEIAQLTPAVVAAA